MNYEDSHIKDSMKSILETEKSGIDRLIQSLDNQSIEVVKLCRDCIGKVVFTGMGKSGHIARKISATMASLGTPSFFLHPAEAVHGDLGMLQVNDIVIMLSNSGGTDELIQLVPSIKLIGCRLIGVFCRENSILSKYCDLSIVLPVEREACTNNLAPTTSTTVTLAYGDAIAVALSELNKFSDKEFALFHPRGALGKKLLLTAESLCEKHMEEISVGVNQTVEELLFVITKNRLGAVAVRDDKKQLLGIISDGDIRRMLEKKKDIFSLCAGEIMTKDPVTVRKDTLAVDTFHLMKRKKVSVIPVIDKGGLLIGMVSLYDVVNIGIV